jgi:hypothetical protein
MRCNRSKSLRFAKIFTTDGTDDTDGKEKKKFGKQELFIREIREIRGSISLVAAGRAGSFAPFRGHSTLHSGSCFPRLFSRQKPLDRPAIPCP